MTASYATLYSLQPTLFSKYNAGDYGTIPGQSHKYKKKSLFREESVEQYLCKHAKMYTSKNCDLMIHTSDILNVLGREIILANLVDSLNLVNIRYKAHPLIIPVNQFKEYT